MNLIEQLGGYEKVKAFLNATSFTIDELIMMQRSGLRTQHVEKALLEYRRQHNIFEVGDAVIRKWNGRLYYLIVDIDNDGQEFLIHHDKGAKFKDCRISDNICNFKHATDEEIKAGKRLEVDQ